MWHPRPKTVAVTAVLIVLIGWIMLPSVPYETAAGDLLQPAPVELYSDGSIVVATDMFGGATGSERRPRVRYEFGLPKAQPARRWMENDALPIAHTQWE